MVPYNKMSKRQKFDYNKTKRVMWDFKPTTRIKPSAKIYDRKKVYYA